MRLSLQGHRLPRYRMDNSCRQSDPRRDSLSSLHMVECLNSDIWSEEGPTGEWQTVYSMSKLFTQLRRKSAFPVHPTAYLSSLAVISCKILKLSNTLVMPEADRFAASTENVRPKAAKRFITTQNANGQSVFSTTLSNISPSQTLHGGCEVALCYVTDQFPVDFKNEADLAVYQQLAIEPPGFVMPNGCIARLADFPPGYTSPMHRTITLNFNFIIQGRMELILDSGETRELEAGDVAIQRAVNHRWKNMSTTEWARMTAIVFPAIPPDEGGADAVHSYSELSTPAGTDHS